MSKLLFVGVVFALVCGLSPVDADAQLVETKQVLTLEGAKVIAAGAEAMALANSWKVVIVVADANGDAMVIHRMDGVQLASLQIAQLKAKTAALYRRPTKVFADRLTDGNQAVLTLPDVIPLEGGLPIEVGGAEIGSVGVSGVRGDQDAQISQAGIDALLKQLDE